MSDYKQSINRRHQGFTLVEILISLALGLLLLSFIFELAVASQHTLRTLIDLSELQARSRKVTDILRSEIHRAHGKVTIVNGNQLGVSYLKFPEGDEITTAPLISHTFFVEQKPRPALVMIDASNKKQRLVSGVDRIEINETNLLVDVLVHITAGETEGTFHVVSSLK